MKMYFYRGLAPNFGDELNHWLLPKVFPDFFDEDESRLFLGIGSILFDHHPAKSEKIVFGSGFAGYTNLPTFDESWKIYCVRGPRTAAACGIDPAKVAGDSAILINRYRNPAVAKTRKFGFIPHWQSIERGNWQRACALAGIDFIDPRHSVDDVLAAIMSTEVVITEAMHGAIVADALRVPWVPILPFHASHHMKWFDWAEALDIALKPLKITASTLQEHWVMRTSGDGRRLKNATGLLKAGVRAADFGFVRAAALSLRKAAKSPPMLSSDQAMDRVVSKLEENAAQILSDYR